MYEKIKYICEYCGDSFDSKEKCLEHEGKEKLKLQANKMLSEGKNLGEIQEILEFWKGGLPKYLKDVTQENCFEISLWQCCEKPAYQIKSITMDGSLILGGCGSFYGYWEGYCKISDNCLRRVFPKEKLFVYHK